MKRIKEVKITESFFNNDLEKFKIECYLMQKRIAKILDRTITFSKITIKYDSQNRLEISLETLKGEKFIGFNLKNKHIKEIINILETEVKSEDSIKISKILTNEILSINEKGELQ